MRDLPALSTVRYRRVHDTNVFVGFVAICVHGIFPKWFEFVAHLRSWFCCSVFHLTNDLFSGNCIIFPYHRYRSISLSLLF
jgi:hypothetical protein